MSFKLAKETSLRNKYVCYGWIRETENILKLAQIVPDMVKVICLLYFRDDEIFDDVNEKGIQLSSNKKVISSKNYICNNLKIINYGITEICSIQQTKIQWDLKVNDRHMIGVPSLSIGIANNKHDDVDRIYYLFRYNKTWIRLEHRDGTDKYGVTLSGDKLSDRQEKIYDDGDRVSLMMEIDSRVSLHLDLIQKKIKLIVNGFDFGFASVPIVTSPQIQYRLCVIFDQKIKGFSSVEILDFKIY